MPIPYMGSKRDIAGIIYQTIKNLNPNADTLVDLFCGGFAVGEFFLKNRWKVIANDKNKYVVALLKKTIIEGLDEKKVLEFITREKFFDVVNFPFKYEDWYVGYVMCIWSFGNNQRSYLYGKEAEQYKKAAHNLIIDKYAEDFINLFPNIPKKIIEKILSLDNWNKRRIAITRLNLQHLQQLQHLEHLERLERLEQVKNLPKNVVFYSDDYKNIPIPNNAIIYCDPPYEGTAKYKEDNFNHKEFWQWCREKAKTHKIYISEYQAPPDFRLVLEVPRVVKLQGGSNKSRPTEKLFTYGKSG